VIIVRKDPDSDDTLFLTVDWRDPEQASALANSFAEYTNRNLAHQLTTNLTTGLRGSIVNIKSNIEYKRSVAKMSRENQIAILEEAAQKAESLGYTEPVEHTATNTLIQITPPEQFFLDPKILTEPPALLRQKRYFPMYQFGSVARSGGVSTQGSTSPLYFRGSRVLRAEIEFLRNRTSDDPYIPELVTLLEQLT
jgi:LPS O-antigen subunit length determinant protein (WzzB/FepE family)